MWARIFEFVLGIWLFISWIIFKYQESDLFLLWNDFSLFFLISFFSLFSHMEKLRKLHLLNFLLAGWLFGFSYFIRNLGLDAMAQNYMFLSLLLFIFSMIPSHARRPPYQWIKFMNDRK